MRRRSLSKAKAGTVKAKENGNSYILGVLDEALFRQQLAIDALDREVRRRFEEESDDTSKRSKLDLRVESAEQRERKIGKDIFCRVEARKEELRGIHFRLRELRTTTEQKTKRHRLAPEELKLFTEQIILLGYGSIMDQPESAWKSTKAREQQFGRPFGFDGEIFYSPLGTPILVGRTNAHKDESMRNAAQGADLWFQVEDYDGARVLLRTSLMRGTAGSKVCRQMAANLAAKYSAWGDDYECVPVMYTDSRKVAKRGSRVGNMKKSKSLGTIMGYPKEIM